MTVLALIAGCAGIRQTSSTPLNSASESKVVSGELPALGVTDSGLWVRGAVAGAPAEVHLDFGRPLSLVSRGCETGPKSPQQVTVQGALGTEVTYATAGVSRLTIGDMKLPPFPAGLRTLASDAGKCVVVLGDDVLTRLKLEIDFPRAVVRTKARAGDDGTTVSLTRTPRLDWPLVAVALFQGGRKVVLPFLFSLQAVRSRLFAHDGGGLQVVKTDAGRAYPLDRLEVAPGLGGGPLLLDEDRRGTATDRGIDGVLGLDFWRHFIVAIHQGTLVIRGGDFGDETLEPVLDALKQGSADDDEPPEPLD